MYEGMRNSSRGKIIVGKDIVNVRWGSSVTSVENANVQQPTAPQGVVEEADDGITLMDLFKIIRKHLVTAIIACVVVVAGVSAYTFLAPAKYTATAQTMATYNASDGGESIAQQSTGGSYISNQITSYPTLATTSKVLKPVIDDLGLDETVTDLAGQVTVTNPTNTAFVNIAVVDGDPKQAADIANSVAESLKNVIESDLYSGDKSPVKLSIVQKAQVPTSKSSPKTALYLAVGVVLGIIIGVASVITMLAIGQGSKKSIQAQISEMGSNMIMIHPGADMRGGVRQDPSAMQTLKLTDYEALRNETNFLAAVSPNVSSSGQLIAGNNNYPSSVSGVGTDYLEIRQLSVENGEMFTEADIQTSAKVCVIGKTIQDNLFPGGEDPVGRIIRFNQVPFRVVGVLKSKGYNSMGMDQDDVVLAPYSTVMKRLLAQTYLSGIFASALTEDMTDNATDEITEILRRNHKLKESDDDDFTIRSQQELSTMLNSTTDLMTTLLACIAGISLVVGGIGIMNIMLVFPISLATTALLMLAAVLYFRPSRRYAHLQKSDGAASAKIEG